jgi:hypothetical protein
LPGELFKPIKNVGLEGLKYHGIHMLYLAISSRMGDGGLIDPNAVVIAKPEEFLPSEQCVVVGDYGVWHSKLVYNVKEKFHRVFGSHPHYGFSLDPLGEFINRHLKVGVAPRCFPEGSK